MEYPTVKVKYDEYGSEAHMFFDHDGDLNIAESDYHLAIPITNDHLDELIELLVVERKKRQRMVNNPDMYSHDLFAFPESKQITIARKIISRIYPQYGQLISKGTARQINTFMNHQGWKWIEGQEIWTQWLAEKEAVQ